MLKEIVAGVILLVIFLPTSSHAVSKSKFFRLVGEYQELKGQSVKMIAEFDAAREQGDAIALNSREHISKASAMMRLHEAVMELDLEVSKYSNAQALESRKKMEPIRPDSFVLSTACTALKSLLWVEIEATTRERSAFIASLRTRYAGIFTLADDELNRLTAEQ